MPKDEYMHSPRGSNMAQQQKTTGGVAPKPLGQQKFTPPAGSNFQLRPGSTGKKPGELTRNDYYVPGKGKLSPADIRAQEAQKQGQTTPQPTGFPQGGPQGRLTPPQTSIERAVMPPQPSVGGIIREMPQPNVSKPFASILDSAKNAMSTTGGSLRKNVRAARAAKRSSAPQGGNLNNNRRQAY